MHFVCHDGDVIDRMLQQTLETGERVNHDVRITALCPTLHGSEPMAQFDLTLSIKSVPDESVAENSEFPPRRC